MASRLPSGDSSASYRISRWPANCADERTVGNVPDRRDAAQAGDAGSGDQLAAVDREMQRGDFPRKLAEQSVGAIGQVRCPYRAFCKEPPRLPRATASHLPSRDASSATIGRTLRMRRNLGHDQGQPIRLFALRAAGPGFDPGCNAAQFRPASGRGSPLGGMLGFATPVSTRIIKLPLGSPGKIAGPFSVPFCSELKDSSENLPSRSSSL